MVALQIKSHLNTLRRRLFTQIVQTLDTDTHAPPPPARASAPATRWFRVRDKLWVPGTGVWVGRGSLDRQRQHQGLHLVERSPHTVKTSPPLPPLSSYPFPLLPSPFYCLPLN